MTNQSDIATCMILPKEWATGAACPVCEKTSLHIETRSGAADQMVCSNCGCAFFVAVDGYHVQLASAPILLTACVDHAWRRPAELRELVFQTVHPRDESKFKAAGQEKLDEKELHLRALELQRLGNSAERIQAILLGLPGAFPEAVEAVMAELKAGQELRQRKILRGTSIAIFSLFFVAGILAFLATSGNVGAAFFAADPQAAGPSILQQIFNPSAASTLQPSPTPDAAQYIDPASLPAPLQTAIPSGAKVLKPPDVIVKTETPTGQRERCPTSPGAAVRLFGGDIKVWTSVIDGWYMVSPSARTIHVPEGMEAGYFVYLDKPMFFSVLGPATIENVNFLAISCQ